ncbi:6-phosphofructo-2-kinase/fructose-2,6-bisphosphatase [Panicum miliaceum]|uniref:6-phosphofructo-2-kinase/fructose-2, 6-bisphosphatase n=1 Tax=Panicum miliaceum TaxID=4540 RepID=A0A3L6R745_PANMI|nr:6-phosphofructo-2-kinase/fructose-2,6-bisphosphatase [Panicum miliaceum]
MERELASMWQLSFVVPPDHETLDFKFLLKPKDAATPCIIEQGPTSLLTGGMLEGDVRVALFKLNGDDEVLEFRVFNKADIVSPLAGGCTRRTFSLPESGESLTSVSMLHPLMELRFLFPVSLQEGSGATLELDLEHYVVPTPTAPPNEYAANLAATPASLIQTGALQTNDMLLNDGIQSPSSVSAGPSSVSADFDGHSNHKKNIETWATDSSKKIQTSGLVESKSVGTFTPLQKPDGQKGMFIDRGVGSPKLPKSTSACSLGLVLDQQRSAFSLTNSR